MGMGCDETILIIDDTTSVIDLIRTSLEKEGYRVSAATSGEKGLSQALSVRPDLILLDIMMPGIDGYETCRRLKESDATREIPLVFLTALTDTVEKVRGFRLGAVDYITKPIDMDELSARVRTHLSLHRMRRELRELNASLEERVRERTAELVDANESLGREIAERQRAEERLRAMLAENSVLLKEVYHRVYNNLQVLISILSLQSGYMHDERDRCMTERCVGRMHSMAEVHEVVYHSNSFARIEFGNIIDRIVEHVMSACRGCEERISVQVRHDEISMNLDRALPAALLVNELAANAVSHAFPGARAGAITIDLTKGGEDRCVLTVSDDGIGLPADLAIPVSDTMGMRLIRAMVAQLKGSMRVCRDRGTSFTVEFGIQ